ncbi:MAG: UDP-N-acetylmuramoyl-L-alanine--D-glutamate ligase [Lachnospiraceae bacterium]|nr:UDP-N-acetylmuramoyl-L-alanine--D-glutamate ligase [Lachnospiraceae bacterium]
MELEGKKVLVAGSGISGIGAAELLLKLGADVIVYDGNEKLTKEEIRAKLSDERAEIVIGPMTKELASQCDLMILSPGISAFGPLAMTFKELKIPVWGEVELAYQASKGRVAAITGTNGKTTTTALLGEILKAQFASSFVVGNIGIPYTSIALDTTKDSVIAAEISSFQLETIDQFRPQVSAVLNVTPDHLDRHGTMENYADTKLSISKNQTKDQVLVLNYDDKLTRAMGARTNASVFYFSREMDLHHGAYLKDGIFYLSIEGQKQEVCKVDELKLLGGHNHENVLAAIAVSYFMGVPVSVIHKVVTSFKAVEHRIEYVDMVNGVEYYNDSKGTNPDAAIKGIQAMKTKTVLIGGGYDKGASYDEWIDAFDGKVSWLVLLGATADAIEKTAIAHGFTNIIKVETFEEAFETASQKAKEGEAVLLSPACASWGMFPNYEVRGDQFKKLVYALKR